MLLSVSQVWAEERKKFDTKYNLGEVIVTAAKMETYQGETGSSSTVISEEDMDKSGKKSVQEALRNIPGVSVMQSGSFGATVYVYLRGANIGHTLTLVDGVEVKDPMQMSGGFFDFAHLTANNIERVEIIRGAQSTVYGSDAIGGVINVITKKGGDGKPKFEISSEGGSHDTFRESMGISGGAKETNYSFSMSRIDSTGISKARDGAEKDGYENIAISSSLNSKIFDNSGLDIVLRYTDAKVDLDDGGYDDDINSTAWWKNIMGKASFNQAINSIWDYKLSFSCSQTRRKYKDDPDPAHRKDNTHNWYEGGIKKLEWQHNISLIDWDTLTCGFEYEEERGIKDGRQASDRFDRRKLENKSCYLQNQFKLLDNLFITPGLRTDYYQLFGAETTYKVSAAYIIPQTGARLKGNLGTGFKSPSLYQLYSSYGSVNLSPEESKSFDFGFEQNLWEERVFFGITHFHNDFKNIIDFDLNRTSPTYYKYVNIGRAETEGFEGEFLFKLLQDLEIGLNYTCLDTKDKNSGRKLAKRIENQAGFNINWVFMEKGNFNIETISAGHSWNDSANTEKVKPYTKVDIYASYDLTENFQIFGKAENLFDRKYAEICGYAAEGQSFYGGCKAFF